MIPPTFPSQKPPPPPNKKGVEMEPKRRRKWNQKDEEEEEEKKKFPDNDEWCSPQKTHKRPRPTQKHTPSPTPPQKNNIEGKYMQNEEDRREGKKIPHIPPSYILCSPRHKHTTKH